MKELIAGLLLALLPSAASAQRPALDCARTDRHYLRLTQGGDAALGRVDRIEADPVWLRYERHPIALPGIRQIETRTYTPDSLVNGILLGAGIGAIAGAFFSTFCFGPCEYPIDGKAVIVGSGLIGAVIGVGVDLAHEPWHWELTWVRP